MLRKTMTILVLACTMLVVQSRASPASDDEASLKKRFEGRYLVLKALKDDGRVGETASGWAEAVEPKSLTQKIDENKPESPTIRAFLDEENSDCQKLYILIAQRTSVAVEEVAKRNARRLFQKASPEHYLKLPDERWVQKKNLKQRE